MLLYGLFLLLTFGPGSPVPFLLFGDPPAEVLVWEGQTAARARVRDVVHVPVAPVRGSRNPGPGFQVWIDGEKTNGNYIIYESADQDDNVERKAFYIFPARKPGRYRV